MDAKSSDRPIRIDLDSIPSGLFINGKWRDGAASDGIDVFDPSNESLLKTVANATVEDGIKAVDAAAAAASAWACTAPRRRAEILLRACEIMTERSEWLATLISLENGKALADARGEVAYAAEYFRWFAEEAVRIRGDISVAPSGNNRIVVQYQPMGIAVLITPWNFPAAMATRKIGPALAAGCTCILKPATETPLTAFAILKILTEAGLPAGVVNAVTTKQPGPVVSAMLNDPRVRKLSFTGSTEVGRRLLAEAAKSVVHCSMELGGNAPFIVFDDADLDAAVNSAMIAKMRNGGEACTAANRFYVHTKVMDEFASRLAEKMGALEVGDGAASTTACGPLVNKSSLDKVSALVSDAVAKGAEIKVGGSRIQRKGYFYAPTVLASVPEDADLYRDEIFGPVAALYPFENEHEVIARANDSEYGLVAYVFTHDLARGMRVSERLEAGMIALNRGLVSDPAAPFGGVKQSGLGREGSHHGILEYLEAKYIAVNW
ncbi:NAD-dependent succinate-semialdehyde dehydrogenase [Pseudooceanicola atlanticus]|uniref:NAD-dependent succinate-semialdehyde dehydrogenase n=1 Tax=Pseudooceanicola atlanticus TaxID=1461694 RepID=UPI002353CF5D|nr:NAD-dependent succinate-semialdehyde dehydrogenase [Pseudooceanicola atlanticus]